MTTSDSSSGNHIPPMHQGPRCGGWHCGADHLCYKCAPEIKRLSISAFKLKGMAVSFLLTFVLSNCSTPPSTCVAIKPTSNAPAGADKIWAYNRDFWPQRSTLRVKFMDGTKSQQDNAWRRFQKIDELVNLTLVRVTSGTSEIRVAFDTRGGHWSFVGKYCAKIPQNQKTMNLALTGGIFGDRSNEWDRVVLHEALHSLGWQHEHQSPQNTIKWNVPAVLAEYRASQGWSDAEIYEQVINRSDPKDFNGSTFDPKSIMMYPISKTETLDGFSVGWNRKLTPTDIAQIKKTYPQ